MELGVQINVSLKNRPELREKIQKIIDEEGIESQPDLLSVLVHTYLGEGKPAPKAKPSQAPKSSDSLFVAPIDPNDQEMVQEMKRDFWKEKGMKEAGILKSFVLAHFRLKEKKAFMVSLAPNTRKKMLEESSVLINDGDIRDEASFIAQVVKERYKRLPKAEKPRKDPPPKGTTPEKPLPKDPAPNETAPKDSAPALAEDKPPKKKRSFWNLIID